MCFVGEETSRNYIYRRHTDENRGKTADSIIARDMDIDAEPVNDKQPEANRQEVEKTDLAATSGRACRTGSCRQRPNDGHARDEELDEGEPPRPSAAIVHGTN
jgi:hypothetical protein